MGQQNQGHNLIVMTNNDVYYVAQQTAKELMALIQAGEQGKFLVVTDVKSGAQVAIATERISSIVVKEGSRNV